MPILLKTWVSTKRMTTGWIRPKSTMPGSVTMARRDRPVSTRIWVRSELPPKAGTAAGRGTAGGSGGAS